ncbi:MAG: S8 family peptidase [Flavobacteriales bacterium]|nr:S8 family peptidase [Flavobacteriales bacterium]
MDLRHALSFGSLLVAGLGAAQTAPDTYWVQFTDKDNTPYSLAEPEQFLSERSIERRQSQGIALEVSDLPVDPAYVTIVLGIGDVQLINRSKWFNAITIRSTDATAIDAIGQLPFVSHVRGTRALIGTTPAPEKFTLEVAAPMAGPRGGEPADYGASWLQISQMNGHLLHAMDAKGQGMLIGVLDSGFEDADSLPAFDDLRAREGVVLERDMVNHDGDVYDDHWHGRSVLSCMTGILPGFLQGTAPAADYVLLRTEEVASEYIVEEDNWVAGAELADSIGCDVLNTSLGYTEFDDSLQNHAYADLDGTTARISIAASMASQKGMIPVNSAGNSGQSAWHFIGPAADAIDILAVGAVGSFGEHAPFSSWGPSADGRVKPDVCAMGWGAIALRPQGDSIAPLNGTSFSSPILAGLVACLWQLHPERTGHEVMQAVRESASLYFAPNDSMGYGIPNFLVAHNTLTQVGIASEDGGRGLRVFPTVFTDHLWIGFEGTVEEIARVEIYDPQGRWVWSKQVGLANGRSPVYGLSELAPGAYVLHVVVGDAAWTARVVRQ